MDHPLLRCLARDLQDAETFADFLGLPSVLVSDLDIAKALVHAGKLIHQVGLVQLSWKTSNEYLVTALATFFIALRSFSFIAFFHFQFSMMMI